MTIMKKRIIIIALIIAVAWLLGEIAIPAILKALFL